MPIYNKLVRDRILERIVGNGQTCKAHIASDEEFWTKLREKLQEEVDEFLTAESEDDMKQELADIIEVIDAILAYKKIAIASLQSLKRKKGLKSGRFEKRIILESTS